MKKYVITLLLSVAAFFSFSQNASYTNLDVRTRTRMMGSVFMTGISNTGTARALYINPATGEVTWSAVGGTIPLTVTADNYSSTVGSEAISFTDLATNDTLSLGTAVGRDNDLIYVARTDILHDSLVITGTPTIYYGSAGNTAIYLDGLKTGALLQSDGIAWYVYGIWEQSVSGTALETFVRDSVTGTLSPAHSTDSKLVLNSKRIIYVPNQTNFVGSLFYGNGGTILDNTGADAGDYNTYAGIGSGDSSKMAKRNTAFGWNALHLTESGWANTAVGYNALATGIGTGDLTISGTGVEFYANTAVGEGSMTNTTTGSYNVATGNNSLYANTKGSYNVALGVHALNSDTTGDYNVAVGYAALYDNLIGDYNIAVGAGALENNIASYNCAIGRAASQGNTSGTRNLAFGYASLQTNQTGSDNVAIGNSASNKTTVADNIAIGSYAMENNVNGGSNVYIGSAAGRGTASGYPAWSVGIGYAAGYNANHGQENVHIGYYTGFGNTNGKYNTAVGTSAGYNNATGDGCVFLGYKAGYNTTLSNRLVIDNTNRTSAALDSTASFIWGNMQTMKLTVNGIFNLPTTSATAGQVQMNNGRILHKYGTYNFFAGDSAGNFTTTGSGYNIGIGRKALIGLTNGDVNTVVGALAGINITTGTSNVAMGYQAIGSIGAVEGDWNIGIGKQTLWSLSSGNYNVAVGGGALGDISTTSNNTAIGQNAGHNATGTGNVFIGYLAGEQQTTGDSKLYIDNSNTTTPLIGGDFATDAIKINGSLSSGIGTIADQDATPTVAGANTFDYVGTNPVTLTDLDNPTVGEYYYIWGNSDVNTVTIADSPPFYLNTAAVLGADDVIILQCKADNYYRECGRTNN